MLLLTNLNYASPNTILFQRLTVILSDVILFIGICKYVWNLSASWIFEEIKWHRFCEIWKKEKYGAQQTLIILAVTFLNAGLFIVDHIHFQYNGMLLGLLILSTAYITQVFIRHGASVDHRLTCSLTGSRNSRWCSVCHCIEHEAHIFIRGSDLLCIFTSWVLFRRSSTRYCQSQHSQELPLIWDQESGVASIYFDSSNSVRLSDWCLQFHWVPSFSGGNINNLFRGFSRSGEGWYMPIGHLIFGHSIILPIK